MFRLVSEAADALATPPRWDGKFWEIANHVVPFDYPPIDAHT